MKRQVDNCGASWPCKHKPAQPGAGAGQENNTHCSYDHEPPTTLAALQSEGPPNCTAIFVNGRPGGENHKGARAVASFCAAVLTGIYLCASCSCHEILRMETARGRLARLLAPREAGVHRDCRQVQERAARRWLPPAAAAAAAAAAALELASQLAAGRPTRTVTPASDTRGKTQRGAYRRRVH
jgi:hypothetical protein